MWWVWCLCAYWMVLFSYMGGGGLQYCCNGCAHLGRCMGDYTAYNHQSGMLFEGYLLVVYSYYIHGAFGCIS